MQPYHLLQRTLLAATLAVQAVPEVSVVASGLRNPRGIALAPDGSLYVAEAGCGGQGRSVVLGDGHSNHYGETGALVRIDPTGVVAPRRVVPGLPSLAPTGGYSATGPSRVAFTGKGILQLTMGLGAQACVRRSLGPKAHLLGCILQVSPGGGFQPGADLAAFESANTPASGAGLSGSNPQGLAYLPGRSVVADAGANTILEVRADGRMRVLAVMPDRMVPAPSSLGLPFGARVPMKAVPTTVAEGPDGCLYAGQLTGFPFPRGGARIYRLPSWGGEAEVYAEGFTNIVDMAFDATGALYVLQLGNGMAAPGGPPLAFPGQLIRVDADGARSLIYANLYYPGGLALGLDGAAYVTNFGIVPGPVPSAFPDGGQVLRIALG